MVARVAPDFSFATSGQPSIDQSSAGLVGMKPQVKFESQYDSRTATLNALLQTAGQLAQNGIQNEQEEAYLAGASKAGMIESEAQLQSDPLYKDWTTAGYRDTMGRMKAADSQAQLQVDMKDLRQQGPEAMQAYLAKQRNELIPTFEGMSREQRHANLTQLITSQQAAVKLHTAEHQKFIIETETASLKTRMTTANDAMTAAVASGSTPAVQSAATDYLALVQGQIWNNPKLANHPSVKTSLVKNAMEQALASENIVLYDTLRNTEVPIGDGKEATLFSQLDQEDQIKLTKAYRETWARTADRANIPYKDKLASIKAALSDPTESSYDMTFKELSSFLQDGIQRGVVTGGEYDSVIQKHLEYGRNTQNLTAKVSAMMNGSLEQLRSLGADESEGIAAVRKQLKGATNLQQMQVGIQIGSKGFLSGYKLAGEVMAPALASLLNSPDGKITTEAASTVANMNAMFQAEEDAGRPYSWAQFLSGIQDQGTQERAVVIRDLIRSKKLSPDAAIAEYVTMEKKQAALTPEVKFAMRAELDKKDQKYISELPTATMFESLGLAIKGMFSSDAAARGKLSNVPGWWQNNDAVAAAEYKVKNEFLLELSTAQRVYPELSDDARRQHATAKLAGRTIDTDQGPLILPQHTTASQYFGTPQWVGQDMLGKALSEISKPKDSANKVVFETYGGRLMIRELDRDNIPVRNDYVGKEQVNAVIQRMLQDKTAKYDREEGAGVVVKAAGSQFNINGDNTAGVGTGTMLRFRQNLIANEGVTNVAKADTNPEAAKAGVITGGIGISSTNDFFPKGVKAGDKWDVNTIRDSFVKASNAAAEVGLNLQLKTKTNDAGFLLFSEIAYQSGPGFTKKQEYADFLSAVRAGDAALANKLFHETGVWRNSGADRKKHYTKLINRALQ